MNEHFIMQELLTLVSRPNNDIQTRIELLKVGILHNISVSLKNIERAKE